MSDDMKTELAVLRVELRNLATSFAEMKGTMTWLNRLVMGLVLSAVVGVVLYGGPLP